MSRLVLADEMLTKLRSELLSSNDETCALLFGRSVVKNDRVVRFIVREYQRIDDKDYQHRSPISAQLRPEVVATAAQRARKTGESIVFAHTHPMPLNEFSAIDDWGEKQLAEFLCRRTPNVRHAAMLLTPEITLSRVLSSAEELLVGGIGSTIAWGKNPNSATKEEIFDRQVRLFGNAGQGRLRELKIGIVGLGGTGSVVLEELVRLGIERFLLIDPDTVESSNLNRLIGSSQQTIGLRKVDVAAEHARQINPKIEIAVVPSSVLLAKVAEELCDTDFLFCCTDSQGSRAVINQLAYQYLIPTIDMGVAIVVANDRISHIAGRTQMLAPGLGCLVCGSLLDPEAVRVDLLTEFERAADPYIIGLHEPAPAVISLNATVASMAVTMFLGATLGIPANARLINYNGITGITRTAAITPHPTCIACSVSGALARANEWPLPARLS